MQWFHQFRRNEKSKDEVEPRLHSPSIINGKDNQESKYLAENTQSALHNIATLIPADATALYLTALNFINRDGQNEVYLWIATLGSLGLALLFRYLAKAPITVWVTTIVSFLIWVLGIGDGLFQFYGIVEGPISGLVILMYSSVLTMLISFGVIRTN